MCCELLNLDDVELEKAYDGLLGHDRSHLSLLGNSETHADGLLNKIVGGEDSSHQSIPFRLLSIE